MKTLICPISDEIVEENAVRIIGLMIAVLLIAYLMIDPNPIIGIAIAVDYSIRAFTHRKFSPLSWLANQLARKLHLQPKPINKGPKIFAARVGFLFAFTGLLISFLHPLTASIILSILCFFALLESVGNICMGCIIYTYIILKLYKP